MSTIPEYLEYRCCMCPQRGSSSQTCPGVPSSLHPEPTPCRFVKRYRDTRRNEYFVPADIETTYKVFVQRPYRKWGKPWRCIPWRSTFDEAQADLNAEAKRRGWVEVL